MISEIYSAPVGSNLKPITEMTDKDREEFQIRMDFVGWVYNRTFVALDEEAINRMAVCVCASLGYDAPINFQHHYAFKDGKESIC